MSDETDPVDPAEDDVVAAGTPRKRRRLRKEEIVAEATRLFAERGFEGASMGDLAERVGLRKASLFHHFASKEALYQAVLGELLDNVRTAIMKASLAEGSFAERLDALSDGLTDALAAQPYAARLLVREAMDYGTVMRGGLGETINEVLSAGLAFARAGQQAGEFKQELDTANVVVSFVGIHFMPFAIGQVVERFTGGSPFDAAFVEARKVAIRAQSRALALVR
ncbi:MAG: Transcriptional regulator, TetR family [Labilithrix sp.]|nr:Transcriptional regulator, TetR family [Labilithrix sp.]